MRVQAQINRNTQLVSLETKYIWLGNKATGKAGSLYILRGQCFKVSTTLHSSNVDDFKIIWD